MSKYIRPKLTGASVFFTVALANRASDLLTREIDILRAAVRDTRTRRPFGIDAWVVLPEHMHCVWTLPKGDADFSGRWREIKGRFSMVLGRSGRAPTLAANLAAANSYGAVGGRTRVAASPGQCKDEVAIWQKRFWEHHLRDEADWASSVRYCWINPVKHGYVAKPEDWAFSSFRKERDGALVG